LTGVAFESHPQRVLVIGVGVIGSVYAGQLAQAGHEVSVMARGRRLHELERGGLRLVRSGGSELRPSVTVLDELPATPFDLVVIAVRRDQAMAAAQQAARAIAGTVLLFGNFAGTLTELGAVIGTDRALAGFPGVGGRVEADGLVTYLQIEQQPTVVGSIGAAGAKAKAIAVSLRKAGFRTTEERDVGGWLASHAALVVPMAAAIKAAGGRAELLAERKDLLHLAVRATSAIYRAQRHRSQLAINRNLRLLYLRMPQWFAVRYWSRALCGEFGELAFAAHTRHAWDEMALLATWLRSSVSEDGDAVAGIDRLIALAVGAATRVDAA
jgi:2-dehydropantoate 2-reductase